MDRDTYVICRSKIGETWEYLSVSEIIDSIGLDIDESDLRDFLDNDQFVVKSGDRYHYHELEESELIEMIHLCEEFSDTTMIQDVNGSEYVLLSDMYEAFEDLFAEIGMRDAAELRALLKQAGVTVSRESVNLTSVREISKGLPPRFVDEDEDEDVYDDDDWDDGCPYVFDRSMCADLDDDLDDIQFITACVKSYVRRQNKVVLYDDIAQELELSVPTMYMVLREIKEDKHYCMGRSGIRYDPLESGHGDMCDLKDMDSEYFWMYNDVLVKKILKLMADKQKHSVFQIQKMLHDDFGMDVISAYLWTILRDLADNLIIFRESPKTFRYSGRRHADYVSEAEHLLSDVCCCDYDCCRLFEDYRAGWESMGVINSTEVMDIVLRLDRVKYLKKDVVTFG